MALDLELLKKELEEAQKQKSSDFWVPEMGENLVRVLPPRDGKLFYRKVGVHYKLVESGMEFCPRLTFNKPCPICETVVDLKKLGSPGAMELVRRFNVAERYMMNVIVLSSDTKGIKQYLAPKTVRLELLKIILDPDYGDITDFETGRNVVIEKVQGSGGFVNYIVRVKPNQVPVSQVIGRKLELEEIPAFDDILAERVKSYDELRYVLFGGDEVGLEDLVGKYTEVGEKKSFEQVEEKQVEEKVEEKVEVGGDSVSIDEMLKKAMEMIKAMKE